MASMESSKTVAGFDCFEDDLSDYEDFLVLIEDVIGLETNEESLSVCICKLPSLEDIIICCGPTCTIKYFHRECVEPIDVRGEWFCESCLRLPSHTNVSPTRNQQVAVASTSSGSGPMPTEREEVNLQTSQEISSSNPTSTTVRSGGMKYPKRRYGKNDAASRAEQYAKTAIDLVFTSPLFEMQTPLVAKVKHLASCVQVFIGSADANAFFKKLTAKLWKRVASVVRGQAWTEECKGQMWQEFQSLRTSHKLPTLWKTLLDKLNIQREQEEEVFLLQHFLEQIFKQLMHEMMEKDMATQVQPSKEGTIDQNEEQALRYCSGYIPAKLLKRYKCIKNNQTAAAFVEVLNSWGETNVEDASTFIAYSRVWLEKQNRGGLFVVKDNVYHFFKAMELIVRASLQQDNIALFQNLSLQTALLNNICESGEVTQKWEQISGPLSLQRKEKLFQEVVKSFLKMRCEAFVKVYIMIRKQKEKEVSKKGERSLRKELSKGPQS